MDTNQSGRCCGAVCVCLHFEADGFWCWRAEVFPCPKFQWGQIVMQFLLHLFLGYTQTVPRDTQTKTQMSLNKHTNMKWKTWHITTHSQITVPCRFFLSWFKCCVLNNWIPSVHTRKGLQHSAKYNLSTYMSPRYWGLCRAWSASLESVSKEKSFAVAALWKTSWTMVPFSICLEPPSKLCITANTKNRRR